MGKCGYGDMGKWIYGGMGKLGKDWGRIEGDWGRIRGLGNSHNALEGWWAEGGGADPTSLLTF